MRLLKKNASVKLSSGTITTFILQNLSSVHHLENRYTKRLSPPDSNIHGEHMDRPIKIIL